MGCSPMGFFWIGLFVLLSCLLGSPAAAEQVASIDTSQPLSGKVSIRSDEYLLGPGDELHFQVLGEPEYTHERVLIQPDGRLSLLGVGIIDAKNLSLTEATQLIEKRLAEFIRQPKVALTLLRPRAGTVYIAGAVMKPGMFQIHASNTMNSGLNTSGNEPVTRVDFRVSNLLAVAGGVQMNADLTRVEVRHAKTNAVETVNMWQVINGDDTEQDMLVQSGDRAYGISVC
jgi:protein involved in polysaccharide export with SLBB domain